MSDFRLLLVEDEPDLNEQLTKALSAIPHMRVDSCLDISSAFAKIAETTHDGAILDFILPQVVGEHGTIDESLCAILRKYALVWHTTAYSGHPAIDEHIRRVHQPDEPGPIIVKDFGFTAELIRQVRQALPARRIRAKIAGLSGTNEADYAHCFHPDANLPSLTNQLLEVTADISLFWHDLHPRFQEELQQTFDVDDSISPVRAYLR